MYYHIIRPNTYYVLKHKKHTSTYMCQKHILYRSTPNVLVHNTSGVHITSGSTSDVLIHNTNYVLNHKKHIGTYSLQDIFSAEV